MRRERIAALNCNNDSVSVTPLRPASCRREVLFADPLLTGELLLIALAWDHLIDTEQPDDLSAADVARLTGLSESSITYVLQKDVPHYESPPAPDHCQHPGCTRQRGTIAGLRDPEDGTIARLMCCHRHQEWGEALKRRHKEIAPGRVPPQPAYNTRSRLAPHFPEVDFPEWWGRLTLNHFIGDVYDQTRDPERGGTHHFQRPRLRIVS